MLSTQKSASDKFRISGWVFGTSLLLILAAACGNETGRQGSNSSNSNNRNSKGSRGKSISRMSRYSRDLPEGNHNARGFKIERAGDYCILSVRDPWQGSKGRLFRYILADSRETVPDSVVDLPFIHTPVKRVVCMSTTHIAMIHALGETGSIIGVSGTDFISNPVLRRKYEAGELADVGADQSLNYERIVTLDPDVLIAYGVTAEVSGMVRRLEEIGIPVLLNADYLENEPLGKTEWLKFIAALYEKEEMADSIFSVIETQYNDYRKLAGSAAETPRVMSGLPWKDSWYIPGANSFAAVFIRDAGGQYIWDDLRGREAVPTDLEAVFARAADADIWINSGNALSLEDIRLTESRLTRFRPYQEGRVYNNIARLNREGGNDFWETGVMEPQLILADLISIFHPGLLPGQELKYYRRLK